MMTVDTISKIASGTYQGSVSGPVNKKPEPVSGPEVSSAQSVSVEKKVPEGVPAPENVSPEAIQKALDYANKMSNSTAVFGYHQETHRITIKIVDKDTEEVIREIPPEKMLDMVAKTWELVGLMVDEKR